jgi:hypothetical protein
MISETKKVWLCDNLIYMSEQDSTLENMWIFKLKSSKVSEHLMTLLYISVFLHSFYNAETLCSYLHVHIAYYLLLQERTWRILLAVTDLNIVENIPLYKSWI